MLKSKKVKSKESKNPLKIAAVHGSFTSATLRKKENMRSDKKIRIVLKEAAKCVKAGTLKRVKKGEFTLNLTKSELRNKSKFENAIKKGYHIEITFKNSKDEEVTRIGAATAIRPSNEGNLCLCFSDLEKNGYRSARLDRTKMVKLVRIVK